MKLTIVVHGEREEEAAALIHALIWLDRKCEIKDVVWICEVCLHRASQDQFVEILLDSKLCSCDLLLLLCRSLCLLVLRLLLLHAPYLQHLARLRRPRRTEIDGSTDDQRSVERKWCGRVDGRDGSKWYARGKG